MQCHWQSYTSSWWRWRFRWLFLGRSYAGKNLRLADGPDEAIWHPLQRKCSNRKRWLTQGESNNLDKNSVHSLDRQKLSEFLINNLPEIGELKEISKFELPIKSNLPLLLEWEIRLKKKAGKVVASAHAVDREYRIIKALEKTSVPVPRTLMLCNNEEVIGTIFYLMDHVDGKIHWDPTLPESDSSDRNEIYQQTVDVLAALHSIDVEKEGLMDFGKPGNYFQRQVGRWIKQYRAAETEHTLRLNHWSLGLKRICLTTMGWFPSFMEIIDFTIWSSATLGIRFWLFWTGSYQQSVILSQT